MKNIKVKKIKWKKQIHNTIKGYIDDNHLFTLISNECQEGYHLLVQYPYSNYDRIIEVIIIKNDKDMEKRKKLAQEIFEEFINNCIEG